MKNKYITEAEKLALEYKKLFIIEKYIKENISKYDQKSDLYFHEYISLVSENFVSEDLRKKLYKLVKVRNKICHMQDLEMEEIYLLNECYEEVYFKFNN